MTFHCLPISMIALPNPYHYEGCCFSQFPSFILTVTVHNGFSFSIPYSIIFFLHFCFCLFFQLCFFLFLRLSFFLFLISKVIDLYSFKLSQDLYLRTKDKVQQIASTGPRIQDSCFFYLPKRVVSASICELRAYPPFLPFYPLKEVFDLQLVIHDFQFLFFSSCYCFFSPSPNSHLFLKFFSYVFLQNWRVPIDNV